MEVQSAARSGSGTAAPQLGGNDWPDLSRHACQVPDRRQIASVERQMLYSSAVPAVDQFPAGSIESGPVGSLYWSPRGGLTVSTSLAMWISAGPAPLRTREKACSKRSAALPPRSSSTDRTNRSSPTATARLSATRCPWKPERRTTSRCRPDTPVARIRVGSAYRSRRRRSGGTRAHCARAAPRRQGGGSDRNAPKAGRLLQRARCRLNG